MIVGMFSRRTNEQSEEESVGMARMGFEKNRRIIADYKAQADWAVVGGKRCYFRSKLEQRWAEYLEFLKRTGAIYDWAYESTKFEFEKVRSGTPFYTPDFEVWDDENTRCFHETKGHLEQKDLTKFRRLQKYHPDVRLVLVMQSITKKNRAKVTKAAKYVERIIEGLKILRKMGF